jgi:hypothetical protein
MPAGSDREILEVIYRLECAGAGWPTPYGGTQSGFRIGASETSLGRRLCRRTGARKVDVGRIMHVGASSAAILA